MTCPIWLLRSDLVNSGYVTFDFDIVATGSNAITVSRPVTGTSVNTKVPGFGTDPANPAADHCAVVLHRRICHQSE